MLGSSLVGALERRAQPRRGMHSIGVLIGLILLCQLTGAIGGLFTASSVSTWYQQIEKPPITPPDWAFPVVWTSLFVLIAVAAWRAWRVAAPSALRFAGTAFAVQLVLNIAWTGLFFGLKSPGAALVGVLALIVAIRVTQLAFGSLDRLAGLLMLPYLFWTLYAAVLTALVFGLNQNVG